MNGLEKVLIIFSGLLLLAEIHILGVGYLIKVSSDATGLAGIGTAVYFSSGPLILLLSIPFLILLFSFLFGSIWKKRKPSSFFGCTLIALSALFLLPAFDMFANSYLNFPN